MNPLISAYQLAALDAALLDVRWALGGPPGLDDYLSGHIPGAAFVDLNADLASAPGAGGRHPLPDPAVAGAALRAAGVSNARPVVVYDGRDSMAAARGWWVLRWLGHRDVRVLDGGYQAWIAAGLPVETGAITVAPGNFVGAAGAMPVFTVAEVQAIADGDIQMPLIDARAGERFRGETEPIDPVAGHIPGAISIPTAGNLNSDGTFRSSAELAQRFATHGVEPDGEAAAYCGSGVTACHTLLAMEIAGIEGGALFPESWSGWITDPTRPIASGS